MATELKDATLSVLDDVAKVLGDHGLKVTVEYPGFLCIWAEDLVAHPQREWHFGTANGTWEGDLNDGNGVYLNDTRSTGVSKEETDAAVIAAAILKSLNG